MTVRLSHRDKHDKTMTGKSVIKRTTEIFLNNLSSAPSGILVRVRVPVSEIGDVSVESKFGTQTSTDGYRVQANPVDRDGFADLLFSLDPHCNGEYSYEVTVEHGRKVQLSF